METVYEYFSVQVDLQTYIVKIIARNFIKNGKYNTDQIKRFVAEHKTTIYNATKLIMYDYYKNNKFNMLLNPTVDIIDEYLYVDYDNATISMRYSNNYLT